MKQFSREVRQQAMHSKDRSIEQIWQEIQPYSRPISVGVHSYLPDGRPLKAGFATDLPSGSFKERGALTGMLEFHRRGYERAVAFSAGNHAAGFALGALVTGMRGRVYVPSYTPEVKVKNTLAIGEGRVEIVRVDGDIEDAHTEAAAYAKEHTAPMLKPSDLLVGYGQGTVAHELVTREPGIDHLLVPAGYGGLALGCIEAIKQAGFNTKVYGVKMSSERELCEGAHVAELSYAAKSVIADNPDLWGGLLLVDPADVGAMIGLEDSVRSEGHEAMGGAANFDYPEATALLGAAAAHKYFDSLHGSIATLITGSNADHTKLDTLYARYRAANVSPGGSILRVASGYQLRGTAA
ncbi:MAG: pyridoxal-phosphate dependent enzyme [Candidatus Saccharimonadales bacterium]